MCILNLWSCVMTVAQKAKKMQIPENKEWYVYTSLSAGGMKLSARLWLCEIEGDSEPTWLWICHPHSPHRSLRKSELTLKFFWCALHTRRNGHLRCLIESLNTKCARRYGDHFSTFPAVERKGRKMLCVCVYIYAIFLELDKYANKMATNLLGNKNQRYTDETSLVVFSPLWHVLHVCCLYVGGRKNGRGNLTFLVGGYSIFIDLSHLFPWRVQCMTEGCCVSGCAGGLVMTLAPRKQGYFI